MTNSNPSPALVAATPALKTVLTELKAAITTILTGDPMQIPLRVGPAVGILLNQIVLVLPELATAEETVVLQDTTSKIDGLIAKLPS